MPLSRQWVLIPIIAFAASAQILSFRDACARAGAIAAVSPAAAEEAILAAGLRNPFLALRETQQYLGLPFGARVLERLAISAPDEAMSVASGGSPPAAALRAALLAGSPELRLLAALAQNSALDLPSRRRG